MADNSSFNYSVGLHNVGSYRVSGDPFNEDNIPSDPDDGSWVGR